MDKLVTRIIVGDAAMRKLPNDWDGYGAVAPTELAAMNAMCVMAHMLNAGYGLPEVSPADNGGIAMVYSINSRYTQLNVDNEGQMVLLIRNEDPRKQAGAWLFDVDDAGVEEMICIVREETGGCRLRYSSTHQRWVST